MITIVTPTLNAAATVENLLKSIAEQTAPCEHIIVDGGSTDGTKALVAKYPSATWVDAPGSTIYSAQNVGIDLANGDWLYFIGADDTLFASDTVNQMTGPAPLLRGKIMFAGGFARPSNRQQSFVYRRDLFRDHGLYDTTIPVYADMEFTRKLMNAGIIAASIPVTLAHVAPGGFSYRWKP